MRVFRCLGSKCFVSVVVVVTLSSTITELLRPLDLPRPGASTTVVLATTLVLLFLRLAGYAIAPIPAMAAAPARAFLPDRERLRRRWCRDRDLDFSLSQRLYRSTPSAATAPRAPYPATAA